ncbi:MAG: flagellar hook-length control protein FliK [gamma proteobacterium symbiont of Bathyaustriella thionipta]|nr:flagellar hook-length control protein FliK [gamma proteobacterium symbiont of Bathyaustriella thionipta]MCU7949113.1 flagellar hook-length control protein FliK [gamma proteobacterium symbiont of Bathyaustriella thionipta]MCU7954424.1 flagellar hook-length control protein FliK [gamma proteobacterium symbiont of Bathyaustriella thionipta]MCU7955714.1 flagellar hook-length control protein FliK [gamma proteobacterium symbiont of Bathyaustriella thionipta]MCU7966192.1 flagellar hook-length contro
MQPIDTSKLSTEIKKNESNPKQDISSKVLSSKNTSSEEMSNKITAAIADKQRIAIGLLLKQTLQNLSQNGLLAVDTQKAILSAKQILPGEFTQLYIQDRVQQHKLAEVLASQPIKPEQLTLGTLRQWYSGQLIQSIVYQAPQNNIASLLVNKSGQFPANIIADLTNKTISNELINKSQVVEIKTNLPLKAGQQLLLYVNKNASEVTFQLKHPPAESNQISQLINQLATKQQAIPQLLASLREITTQTHQANTFFTPKFKQQVDNVLQQFPQLSQLSTSKEVKTTLNNSGTFLESRLLNSNLNKSVPVTNSPIAMTDLKAGLSQLVSLIQNDQAVLIPKLLSSESSLYKNIAHDGLINSHTSLKHMFDLPVRVAHAQVQMPVLDSNIFQLNNHLLIQSRILDQLEGVLSRIVINQFHAREGGDQSFINFEIPFRHNDQQEVLQLKIRERLKEKEAEQGNKIWTVNLAFHLNTLGGIRIYITLDQQDLAIQFWTEKKHSQYLFEKYFSLLSKRLLESGFTLSQLAAFHGMPEEARKEQRNSEFIIDEQV